MLVNMSVEYKRSHKDGWGEHFSFIFMDKVLDFLDSFWNCAHLSQYPSFCRRVVQNKVNAAISIPFKEQLFAHKVACCTSCYSCCKNHIHFYSVYFYNFAFWIGVLIWCKVGCCVVLFVPDSFVCIKGHCCVLRAPILTAFCLEVKDQPCFQSANRV